MTFRYRAGHLGDVVDLYVDGRLDAESTRRAARHLLACETCRADVDAERAIVRNVRAVRVDPERHACLVAGLLSLTAPPPQDAPARPVGPPLVDPDDPAPRRPRFARHLAAVTALTAGAAALVVSTHGPSARQTPAAPHVATRTQTPAPQQRREQARTVQVMQAKSDASGRMAP